MMTMRVSRGVVLRVVFTVLAVVCPAALEAEVLIRWDQDRIPPPANLGVTTVVVPAANTAAVEQALAQGYRVLLEIDVTSFSGVIPAGLAGIVMKGKPSPLQLQRVRKRLPSPGARVLVTAQEGKWPHIRTNWVTKNNQVLQVTGRSAQPWIENNAALIRILRAANGDAAPVLTYTWSPMTLADADEGPALHNYLVAIAEAGSYGADLVLPLHQRFAQRLLLGEPHARAEWDEIKRYIEFYAWGSTGRYRPMANIAVVAAEPMRWLEIMNLLLRHNLPFEIVTPAGLAGRDLTGFVLAIVLDDSRAQPAGLTEFVKKGGRVIDGSQGLADPNAFALDVRQSIGAGHRVIDIWNGITVLAAPYQEPEGRSALVMALNYAEQPVPVQLRVRGLFSLVQYETPGEPASLLPYRHRDGCTEFVLPALRAGGRIFLSGGSSQYPFQ
jgi:hypothetical protein